MGGGSATDMKKKNLGRNDITKGRTAKKCGKLCGGVEVPVSSRVDVMWLDWERA